MPPAAFRRRLCMLLLASALPAAAAPTLRVATTDLPPFASEGTPAQPGALHELTGELLRRAGYRARIDFVPWKRALFMASHFPRTAVFPLTRTPERERQYRWLAPLYHEHFVLMAEQPAGGPLDPAAFKARRVALLRGSAQEPELRRRGFLHVVPTASVAEGLRFLHTGIVDALYGDTHINLALARTLYPQVRYAVSAPMVTTDTWLGGSLDLDGTEAARLAAAMQAMHDDGTYQRLLRKYGLEP